MRSIQEERISQFNDKDVRDGDYVLYWMQDWKGRPNPQGT